MGDEYQRWLIAKGNVFSPGAASVVKLVEQLRKENWIAPQAPALAKLRFEGMREQRARATGGYAVKTVENAYGSDLAAKVAATTEELPAALSAAWLDDPSREELRLVWPMHGDAPLPLKYPLSRVPDVARISYSLEIHRADDYVYPDSESIGALPTTCKCGEDLSFEWDDDELVPAFSGASGIFTECEECSNTFDPSKGSALVTNPFDGATEEIRGGGAYRFALKVDCGKCFVRDPMLAFAPELVALVEREFGRAFYEVGCVY